jgi:hypothetical protein
MVRFRYRQDAYAMMLAGLALGCDGLRVGLEDNIYYSKGVIATNLQLVERAVEISKIAGREIATAEDAREILGITRHCLRDGATHEPHSRLNKKCRSGNPQDSRSGQAEGSNTNQNKQSNLRLWKYEFFRLPDIII